MVLVVRKKIKRVNFILLVKFLTNAPSCAKMLVNTTLLCLSAGQYPITGIMPAGPYEGQVPSGEYAEVRTLRAAPSLSKPL